jgi:hypothetical protein
VVAIADEHGAEVTVGVARQKYRLDGRSRRRGCGQIGDTSISDSLRQLGTQGVASVSPSNMRSTCLGTDLRQAPRGGLAAATFPGAAADPLGLPWPGL